METGPQPCIFVLFGITGDLAQRKLLPALYHLYKDNLVHEKSVIVGITRREVTADDLLGQVELCVNEVDNVCDPAGIAKIRKAVRMHKMSLTDGDEYDQLLQLLNTIEDEAGVCMTRLYYLSIPPQMFQPIVSKLGQHGLNMTCPHGTAPSRLLVEKPFGYSLESAQHLITATGEWFNDDQLFRIDHYIAKDAVQDILGFRRSNPAVEALWNSSHISSIEVTAYETLDIEGRAVFYDEVGALRDFIQSHLLQVLAIVTMDLPADMDSDSLHAAKGALLAAVSPLTAEQVAAKTWRGQYTGYREEAQNPDSHTETFARLELDIASERWHGVPMILNTGKAMENKKTEAIVTFGSDTSEQKLTFDIANDSIVCSPNDLAGEPFETIQTAVAAFRSEQSSTSSLIPDGYERVLLDAIRGDHALFTTSQEVIDTWKIVEQVLNVWSQSDDGLVQYAKGSSIVG